MEPKTLTSMSPSEQQLKNRLLASEGKAPVEPMSSPLDSINTYNPQTIMDKYASARKLTTESAAATAKKLESEYSTAVEDTNIADTKDLTSTLEGQTGFAQMPVALNYMQISHDKRIRDLTKQKNELLLANESDKAKRLSDLILNEETAISDARTKFLTNYFNIQKENRDAASFETPDRSAIRQLQTTAPDAGILDTDSYQVAIDKYKNSATYKRNVRKGEADIAAVEANAAQSRAAAAKSLSESGAGVPSNYNGEFAATIQAASSLLGSEKATRSANALKSYIAAKDYKSAYNEIANNVEQGLTGTPKTTFADARTDIGVMQGMRDAVQRYKDAGGNTNILKGTEEEIKRKLGIDSGKASALAVQLWREFQTYRLNMTGAAFSPEESKDYASVNPTLGKSLDLNLSVIDGAINQLNNRVAATVDARVPGAKYIREYATGAAVPGAPAGDKSLSTPTFQGFKLKY